LHKSWRVLPRGSFWTVRVHPTPPRARQKGGPRRRPVRRPCPWTQSSPPASSHLASWSSPPYRSVIAGLLRASPSAKSHGPPPPLAVKKAQSWPCAAVEEAADSSPAGNALQGAPHADLLTVSPSSFPHRAATLPPPACPPRAPPRGADHEARGGGRGRGAAPSSCPAARGGRSCGPPRFIRLAGRQLLSRGGPAWRRGGGSIRPEEPAIPTPLRQRPPRCAGRMSSMAAACGGCLCVRCGSRRTRRRACAAVRELGTSPDE